MENNFIKWMVELVKNNIDTYLDSSKYRIMKRYECEQDRTEVFKRDLISREWLNQLMNNLRNHSTCVLGFQPYIVYIEIPMIHLTFIEYSHQSYNIINTTTFIIYENFEIPSHLKLFGVLIYEDYNIISDLLKRNNIKDVEFDKNNYLAFAINNTIITSHIVYSDTLVDSLKNPTDIICHLDKCVNLFLTMYDKNQLSPESRITLLDREFKHLPQINNWYHHIYVEKIDNIKFKLLSFLSKQEFEYIKIFVKKIEYDIESNLQKISTKIDLFFNEMNDLYDDYLKLIQILSIPKMNQKNELKVLMDLFKINIIDSRIKFHEKVSISKNKVDTIKKSICTIEQYNIVNIFFNEINNLFY